MTIAEKLRQEGRKEGRKEGEYHAMKKVAHKMLLMGEEESNIMKYTNLSEEEITEIKQSLEK